MKQGIGHPKPGFSVSPRSSQFRLVFSDVLIGAVPGKCISLPRATDCRLESLVSSNHLVRQNSAIAPAPHAQTGGIRHALRHGVVYGSENVLPVLVAPISPDGGREFLSPAGAAPRIGRDHGKPLG